MANRQKIKGFIGYGASLSGFLALYIAAGKFGLSVAFLNSSASPVWPPTGMALAAMLLFGWRLWPAVFIGAFVVNFTTPDSAGLAVGPAVAKSFFIGLGNTAEAICGAWLVNRYAHGVRAFERAQTIFRFVALAAVLSTSVSAACGVTSLCASGAATWEQFGPVAFTWWLGDVVSDLIVAPLLVVWMRKAPPRAKAKSWAEAAGLTAVILVTGGLVFLGGSGTAPNTHHLGYLTIPPLLWAAFRFGERGAATFAFIISGFAVWGTLHQLGPFVSPDANQALLYTQAFMGTIAVTTLVLAALISERNRAEQRFQVQEAVSRALAESDTVMEAAPKIFQALFQVAGWEAGALWQVNRLADEIYNAGVWRMGSVEISDFEAACREIRFARGTGLPGRVWKTGEPIWSHDVTRESNFPRAATAAKSGLHGGLCFPIKAGEEVLGVIECFSRGPGEMDENFLRMCGGVGQQLGQFVERKKAEEAVRRNERELADFFENASQGLHWVDANGIIVRANRAELELLGYSADEYIGRHVAEFHVDRETIEDMLKRLAKGETLEEYPSRMRCKDGSIKDVLINSSAYSEGGQFIHTRCFTRDVTELKAAYEVRARLAAIVESSEDAIISKSLDGIVTSWNAGAERLLGYRAEEMIGQPITRIVPADRQEEENRIVAHLRSGKGIEHYETVRLTKDGRGVDVSLTISPLRDSSGATTGASKILRDITEQKRTEVALRQSQENLEKIVMERTARLREVIGELEAFSYSVSHDMRAPLRAMQGYSRFLLEEFGTKLGPEGADFLKRISSSAIRLDRLIQDVLTYSRVIRSELRMAPIDLDHLVRETLANYPEWNPPNAEVQVEGKLPKVMGNEAFLTQCITNLVSNAVKFVRNGEIPRVKIRSETAKERVRLCFEDNGIGIAPKDQQRIFGMFERLHGSESYEGTGIGLAIVRKAVDRMGGQLSVESEPGKGSTFCIELRPAETTRAVEPVLKN